MWSFSRKREKGVLPRQVGAGHPAAHESRRFPPMIVPADGDFRLDREADTARLGAAVAGELRAHEAICLSGPLGAGLFLDSGTAKLTGVSITSNKSDSAGGGLYVGAVSVGVTITGGSVTNNSSVGVGGGIDFLGTGTLAISKTIISGNNSAAAGGGLYVAGGGLTLGSVHVSNNSAIGDGGGLAIAGSTPFTITTGSFTGNGSDSRGGGIDISGSATGSIDTPAVVITDNFAAGYGGGVTNGSSGTVTMKTSSVTGNVGGSDVFIKTDVYGPFA